MTFWRAEFAPRTPGDKFEKQYAYNIRHNYGKEGNRKSYTPYSCLKVISATPGVVRPFLPALHPRDIQLHSHGLQPLILGSAVGILLVPRVGSRVAV